VPWHRFDPHRGVLTLSIQAQPGAKKRGITPYGDDALKVRVDAPAVDGRANDALCELIAERLGLPRAAVRVVRGLASRRKLVEVRTPQFDPVLLCDAASKRNGA
jgi:uncharacterized protein (TIGR00251 family)